MASSIPTVEDGTGFKMPLVGFGTWQTNGEELEAALNTALEEGYRHIDTAYSYLNESVIGKVLQEWFSSGKLQRDDIFVTTKLPVIGIRPELVDKFIDLSLEKLQLEYVDLYLMHVPFGLLYQSDDEDVLPLNPDGTAKLDFKSDIIGTWKKMEELVDNGKAKAIGLSNFGINQVERILNIARIHPATNQIQLNIKYQLPSLVKFLQENKIIVTSYSTLGTAGTVQLLNSSGVDLLGHPVVVEIASNVERTPAQVLLRHMVQKNIVVIPKSVHAERIKGNFQLFDFELSEDQMEQLDTLDEGTQAFKFSDMIRNIGLHPEFALSV